MINLDKEIKAVIILIFHMFKKLKERLKMLSRNTDNIKKNSNQLFRDENYNAQNGVR